MGRGLRIGSCGHEERCHEMEENLLRGLRFAAAAHIPPSLSWRSFVCLFIYPLADQISLSVYS